MSSYDVYNNLVNESLQKLGLRIRLIDSTLITSRLNDIMHFVNGVRMEYADAYGWEPESEAYFLNPMVRKFEFSYIIEEIKNNNICFLNFSSVYNDFLHLHCAYGSKTFRGANLAKCNHLIVCNSAIDSGIYKQDAYWPKHNNGSIILFLKMGWKIEDIRKNGTQLYMIADNTTVRNNIYKMLLNDKQY